GCSPDREQKQVHILQGNADLLKGPANNESACDSEQNVGSCPESVVSRDFAGGPTRQPCGH
ncbi:MAG: hypothetical protein WAM98_15685, partial [Terriglobales bacterium]